MTETRKSRVQRFYNDFAPNYESNRYGTDHQRKLDGVAQEMVLRLLWDKEIKQSKVLDCGCGSGRFSDLFSKKGASVLGIDASPNMLDIARKRAPQATFQIGDVANLGFHEEFDIAICSQVLTHLHDYKGPLLSMQKAIRPGGIVIVDFRNLLSPMNALYALRTQVKKSLGRAPDYDPHFATIGELTLAAKEAGLQIDDWKPCGQATDVSNSAMRMFHKTIVLRLSKSKSPHFS